MFFGAVKTMATIVKANKVCYLATIGGGCPDEYQCALTCSTCYRGVGKVASYCRAGGGGFPYDSCVCAMSDGAPCSPSGPPKCPNWPRPHSSTNLIEIMS